MDTDDSGASGNVVTQHHPSIHGQGVIMMEHDKKASSSSSIDVKPKNKVHKDQASSSSSSDDQRNKQVSKDPNTDTAGDERLQTSAPLDVAELKIKVDWTGPIPEKWGFKLEKAIQSWLSLKTTASVKSIELMSDQTFAKVQITPPTENSGDVSYPLTYMTDYDKKWIFFPRAVVAVC
ncbi:E3 ubiquitin- ligase DTX3L-like isoform X1 [Labeo rohita]|uniref:E3 ubiquitin-ligase DTX3L-like isoform X1 n=1 Tax=Labeo rohita TaxID=84645 RepID=A0A498NXJ1_LABRO|nr:E3 ubiquitin- ligase DTX3L-like isoform X1 [Labeo rohita]